LSLKTYKDRNPQITQMNADNTPMNLVAFATHTLFAKATALYRAAIHLRTSASSADLAVFGLKAP